MINPHPVLPEFEYIQPENTQAAIQFLKSHPHQARPFLGGTDCFVAMRDKKITPAYLVDLKHLEDFDVLTFDSSTGLTIGAAVNMNILIASPSIQNYYPLIAAAAREVGSYQLRSRATLVGNICNASPCGDTIAPCLVYAGNAHILTSNGERDVPLKDFFKGPGSTILEPGEIVQSLQLPPPPTGARGVYRNIGRNALGDLAIVAVTVLAFPQKSNPSGFEFRIALSAVAPTVIFAPDAQQALAEMPIDEKTIEKASQLASQACKPIDDIRASARYRREMVYRITHDTLLEVWESLHKEQGG